MTALVAEDLASALHNYADAIEGGNSYRGSGTSYKGIPGLHSSDEKLLRDGYSSITVSSNGTTTTIPYASGSWANADWVKTNTPGFWAVDSNDEHRKISAWDNTGKEFTVAAFTTAPAQNDTILIQQGFKRVPEGMSLMTMASGYDRLFELRTDGNGVDEGYSGAGVATYRVPMILAVRLLKYGKDRTSHACVLTNLKILTEGLLNTTHRSGVVRALIADGAGSVAEEDSEKVIAEQTFDLIYRISTVFK
jgi:hypothetical protein